MMAAYEARSAHRRNLVSSKQGDTPMTRRNPFTVLALAVAICSSHSTMAQRPRDTGASGGVSRLPDGKPDLQGVWDFRTITPLDRPTEMADRKLMTDEDVAKW